MQVHAGLDYNAEPADIWSCGIVLVAMLAGGMKYMYMYMYVYTMYMYIMHIYVYIRTCI